jgi:hypothetical protein
MKWVAIFACLLSLCACRAAEPTPEQAAALQTVANENQALVVSGKLTHVEAAKRYNAEIEKLSDGKLSDQDQLLMSYRLALASQVDAKQITEETAKYEMVQRMTDIRAADAERRSAALRELGESLQRTSQQMQQNRPVMCNSNSSGSIYGNSINSTTSTMCY